MLRFLQYWLLQHRRKGWFVHHTVGLLESFPFSPPNAQALRVVRRITLLTNVMADGRAALPDYYFGAAQPRIRQYLFCCWNPPTDKNI